MRECIQPYYIKDGFAHECSTFHVGLINEGKSIYEVVRLSGNRLLFIDDHLDRLYSSLRMEGIVPWLSRDEILSYLEKLITQNNTSPGNIKIVINVHPPGIRHFLAYYVAHRYPSEGDYNKGVKVITFPFERKEPNKKVWRPAFRKKVNEVLQKNDAFEVLLLDSKGLLPEASKANIFCIKNNAIITPPDEAILPGITRKYILEACRELNFPVDMRKISLLEMEDLEGLFLTGTSLHVLPVCCVNEHSLPTGNERMRQLMTYFNKIVENQLDKPK